MTIASTATWDRRAAAAPIVIAPRSKAEGPLPFVALIAFTCILLLNPQAFLPALKPLRIAFLSAGLGGAALVWEQWRDRKPLGLSREILPCFLLVTWACMTVPLSYWPGGSVQTLTDEYIKAVIVFWLLANVVVNARRLAIMTLVLMLCSVPLAIMAVKNYTSGTFIYDSDTVVRIAGYGQGLSSNLNDLALMLNLLLPLSMARFLSAKRTVAKVFCIAVIAISVTAIIVTFSRAGFLGLATIAMLYLIRMLRRGRDRIRAVAIIFAVLLALPLIPSSYFNRIATVTNVESDTTGSSQERWRDLQAAMQYVSAHPITGAGLGMDIFALNQVRGDKWVQVHNVYLEYAVDLGLPGASLFLALFYAVFSRARASRKALAGDPDRRDLFLINEALETALIVFAICAFFHPVAYNFFFYYIGGLALGARTVTRKTLEAAGARA